VRSVIPAAAIRRVARGLALTNGCACRGRQANLFLELGGVCIFGAERQRLPNAPTRLLKRAAVGVAAAEAHHARDPRAALVAFEGHSVVADLLPGHVCLVY